MGILEERRKKMGLPAAAGAISQAPVTAPNKFKALADLKRGAKKGEFRQFIKAEKKVAASQEGFQIPEAKTRRNPNESKSKNAIAPTAKIPVKQSAEAKSLEEMMFGSGGGGVNVSSTSSSNEQIVDIVGPTFDPQSVLQKKQAKSVSEYSQFSQTAKNSQIEQPKAPISNEMSQIMEMMEVIMKQKNTSNMPELKTMMETIAKRVAENTMKTVINEFVEKTKKQNLYEVYSKSKNIVKIKGKLYKLTPVKLKDH